MMSSLLYVGVNLAPSLFLNTCNFYIVAGLTPSLRTSTIFGENAVAIGIDMFHALGLLLVL